MREKEGGREGKEGRGMKEEREKVRERGGMTVNEWWWWKENELKDEMARDARVVVVPRVCLSRW